MSETKLPLELKSERLYVSADFLGVLHISCEDNLNQIPSNL
jgi:hypothetical protein